eukprot:TRINITY_DN230_c0_g1_i1.p1 TRINITY_DN230_c0_g1~~TRINITY_DN230_c0_g1_i1.p1  ORF type:complete len:210 (-),score=22.73 TRINITY_DN230_c0_g1_i1:100-729(-)
MVNFWDVELVTYNLLQSLGWSYALLTLITHLLLEEKDTTERTEKLSSVTIILQILQTFSLLEILHRLLGKTSSALFPMLLQISGRLFFLFGLVTYQELKGSLVVFSLFLAYSFGECCRYPYYLDQQLGKNTIFLSWARYSGFLLFYPWGLVSEWLVIWNALPFIQSNLYFYFCCVMLLVGPLFGFILLKYMLVQRRKKLQRDVSRKTGS